MERTLRAAILLVVAAAIAGCHTTGSTPVELPHDDLTVGSSFAAPFDEVERAVERTLADRDAMQAVLGADAHTVAELQKSWQSVKTPFHKLASRTVKSGNHVVTAQVENAANGYCNLRVRVSTGGDDDSSRAAALVDWIARKIRVPAQAGRRSGLGGALSNAQGMAGPGSSRSAGAFSGDLGSSTSLRPAGLP
jgi:hypothetical protein